MSTRHGIPLAVAVVVAVGLGVAGCGGDDDDSTVEAEAATTTTTTEETTAEETKPSRSKVSVSLGEWFIEPNVDTVDAGEVTFKTTNDGGVVHELIVLKTDIAGADLPVTGDAVDLDKAGKVFGDVHEGTGEEGDEHGVGEENVVVEHLDPGASAKYTMDLKPGSYVLICNIPGHYAAGQWVEFTVK